MGVSRLGWILFCALVAALATQAIFVAFAPAPEDRPWTPLDLRAPVGAFTGRKLAALRDDPARCHRLLQEAGIGFAAIGTRRVSASCGWDDAVRLATTARAPRPAVPLSCPMAAGIDLWMRRVVQPAAIELLGSRVATVEEFGSYACRRMNGDASGPWSEHATADAIDIAGFRLADGRRVTVVRDWPSGPRGAFLHRARDGACRLFATTLSPDYNAAHRDHLHLDQAARGALGWRACG